MLGKRGNIPHVPWSRHMAVAPRSTYVRKPHYYDDVERTTVKAQGSPENPISGSANSGAHRRVKSESSVLDDGKLEMDQDSWDSQSDPGSNSIGKWKRHSSSVYTPEDADSDGTGMEILRREKKKLKPSVQGRGGSQQNVARRRKGALAMETGDDGIPRNGNFVVEIPSNERSDNVALPTNSTRRYVHTYSEFMYYACLNPHKWNRKEEADETRSQYLLAIIQKIIFCYVGIMATFTSLSLIKFFVLNFLDDRTLNNFIDIGYFVVSGLFQLYVVYLIAFRKQHLLRTCKIWDDYQAAAEMRPGVQLRPKTEFLPILNGILTIITAVMKTMRGLHSFEKIILKHSFDTVDGLFLWTPQDFKNRGPILKYYLGDHNTAFYTMGVFGFIAELCWNLLADSFKDLIFWVAKVHEHHITIFGEKIKENVDLKVTSGERSDESDDQCWKMYRDLVAVNTSTNRTYHVLLILNHLDTFLTFSYFLTLILKKDTSMSELIFTGHDVLKGIIAYLPARRASLQNEECRKWIQTLPCETKRFRAAATSLSRDVMLWELKEEPLGLGSGKLHINNEFLVSFITLVASLFCFLLNLDTKDTDAKQY